MTTDGEGAGVAWTGPIGPFPSRSKDGAVALDVDRHVW